MGVEAKGVNNHILKWAREEAGLAMADAAKKLAIKSTKTASAVEKLQSYEDGKKTPSTSLLSKMSEVYRRPLLTFYLSKKPEITNKGEDYRTLLREVSGKEKAWVDALVRNIKVKQSLIRAALIEEDDAEPLAFIGACEIGQKVTEVAELIRDEIGFDLSEYRRAKTPEKAFGYLRGCVEKSNVFVLLKGNLGSHHTDISVTSFRGFALADSIAPFIVINDKDSKSAWSFTLLHELVHLFLGQTGISGGYIEQKIEKYCSDVASEILLPNAELMLEEFDVGDEAGLKVSISNFANKNNVSSSLIAYRLYRNNVIQHSDWDLLRKFYRDEYLKSRRKKKEDNKAKSGPDFYVLNKYRLGAPLVKLVERLNYNGTLSTSKAGVVLGVKPLKVHNQLNYEGAA